MTTNPSQLSTARAIPKLCGADIELGNFLAGLERATGTGYEASRALLAEIKGLPEPQSSHVDNDWIAASAAPRDGFCGPGGPCGSATGLNCNPQDVGRRFLPSNGGSAYIDLNHAELCLPEVWSAFDHVAAWHGLLRIARSALDRANEGQPTNRRIQVLVNNTDGQGNSYGSHTNYAISRRTFDNIFWRKAHYLPYLASFQVSSILLTGQGKVGSENGRLSTRYQISQRADFFETLQGIQTTFNRPIVNARDEALCGLSRTNDPLAPARLHVIFFDSALAHGSCLFRVGPMQLILTLLELGLINSRLILDEPLAALEAYSRDPALKATAELISGDRLSAVELQCAFLDEVKHHASQGVFQGVVPRFDEIIALWEDTLSKFIRGDLMALAPRLDWVMKLMAIERGMEQRPCLTWESPEVKVIDHVYSSLNDDGLYRAYETSGFTERIVTPERVAHFAANPPADTRAWTRAMLLRRATRDNIEVEGVDWDRITFRIKGRYRWPSYRTLDLADPQGFTKNLAEPIFNSCADFGDLLDGLESLASGAVLTKDAIAVS
jgi:proteasome accessory factor A